VGQYKGQYTLSRRVRDNKGTGQIRARAPASLYIRDNKGRWGETRLPGAVSNAEREKERERERDAEWAGPPRGPGKTAPRNQSAKAGGSQRSAGHGKSGQGGATIGRAAGAGPR
jgi:hypothetical protein